MSIFSRRKRTKIRAPHHPGLPAILGLSPERLDLLGQLFDAHPEARWHIHTPACATMKQSVGDESDCDCTSCTLSRGARA